MLLGYEKYEHKKETFEILHFAFDLQSVEIDHQVNAVNHMDKIVISIISFQNIY